MKKNFFQLILVTLTLFSFSLNALIEDNDWDLFGGDASVEVVLKAEQPAIRPGENFWVAVQFNVHEPWHCYWQNPGDTGMGPQLQWTLPPGYSVLDTSWPTPERLIAGEQIGFGYSGPFVLLANIQAPKDAKNGDIAHIGLEIQWVACSNEMCLPGTAEKMLDVPVESDFIATDVTAVPLFSDARSALPKNSLSNAVVQADLIGLELELPIASAITKVDFFPQDQNVINHKEDVAFTVSEKGLMIALKKDGSSSAERLRGVVLVENAQGQSSYLVDAPFKSPSTPPELLAMLDAQQPVQKAKGEQSTATVDAAPLVEFEGGLGLALAMAFIGGMILNLMPCVLPVISLKILSFVKMAGQNRAAILRQGIAFSAGVLVSFWALALLLLALQSYGHAVGWGFQLQEPLFVGILAAVLFLFGLSLFGVFEFGAFFASWVGTQAASSGPQKQTSVVASFMNGVLATAVATPCTGPFLGTAIGFAFSLPAYQALMIFTSLGLGMSFPYLLLSAFPSLLRYVPKPGNWMVTFKEWMGFLMLASAIWLVWVFGSQTSAMAQSMLLVGLFFIGMASWMYGKWGTPLTAKRTRMISLVAAALVAGLGGNMIYEASKTAPIESNAVAYGWEKFDPDRIEELRKMGRPVFVDFTANWCLICKANYLTLNTAEITREMSERGVVRMMADWTKPDPVITSYLKKYGRNGVPLYLLFDGNPTVDAQILPQVLTVENVTAALEKLSPTIVDNSK